MAPSTPGDDDPEPGDVFDYAQYVHDDYGAEHVDFQGDRPGAERFATGEYPAERFPVAGPLAQNYPAETPIPDAEDDTDYENDYRGSVFDELALPGWEAPEEAETTRTSKVR